MLNLKLEIPRQRIPLMMRRRLLQRLATGDNLASPLYLVIASAGYGKTTLLAQWCQALAQDGQKVAWLTLDETDSDPRLFLSYIIFAIRRAGIDLGHLVPHADQGLIDITPEACLSHLADIMDTACSGQVEVKGGVWSPPVLILDDYHRASNKALDALLLSMVRLLQNCMTLVVSARSRPDIGVPNLIASGKACEITADALRLTEDEMHELLDDYLNQAQLLQVIETTEGWPVALQLTRLIARSNPNGTLPQDTLEIRGGYLSSYLSDRVMRTLSDAAVNFLLETSIVEKFNLPLADALRGAHDSGTLIESLEPLQSLVAPLYAEDGWFRYHHLFQEFLRGLLRSQSRVDTATLHLRASSWFEANGHVLEATRHAREAGAYAVCARLIEQAGGWRLILYGGINHLRSLLNLLPAAERIRYPRVCIAEAYLLVKDGKIAAGRALMELALAAVPGPDPGLPSWLTTAALDEDTGCDAAATAALPIKPPANVTI